MYYVVRASDVVLSGKLLKLLTPFA